MGEKWVGITVPVTKLTIVSFEYQGDVIIAIDESTWQLQKDDTSAAYRFIHERISNYINEKAIQVVAIKGSSALKRVLSRSHLRAAELRGVVIAAAAQPSVVVKVLDKGVLSKTFGRRSVDEYLDDDAFWTERLGEGNMIKKGSREAALFVLAARQL